MRHSSPSTGSYRNPGAALAGTRIPGLDQAKIPPDTCRQKDGRNAVAAYDAVHVAKCIWSVPVGSPRRVR